MKFRTHLRTRSPEEAGDGGAVSPPSPPAPAALTKPEGLPDDYWDAEKGVKVDALLPKLQAHDDYFTKVPAKAEDIDWSLPGDLDPDNKDLVYEVNKDDPLLAEITTAALEHKVSQPALTAFAAAYAKVQIAQAKQAREALQAEEKKLGDKFQERIAGAHRFVESVVGKEKAERFRNTWVTAEQVEIIEAIAAKANGPAAATPESTQPTADAADPKARAKVFFGKKD